MIMEDMVVRHRLDEQNYLTGSRRSTAATLQLASAQNQTTQSSRAMNAALAGSTRNVRASGTAAQLAAQQFGSLNRAMMANAVVSRRTYGSRSLGGLPPGSGSGGGLTSLLSSMRGGVQVATDFGFTIGGVSAKLTGLTAAAGLGAAAIGTLAAGVAIGQKELMEWAAGPAQVAANFDALTQSLIAVEGSSRAARAEMKRLMEIAKAPGIGHQESIRAFTQLRNADLGRTFSERLIREFANANAKAGGGPEEFQRILNQVTQIASKQFLQGEELTTLVENGIPAYKIVKDALGTADTAELKELGITGVQVLEAIATSLEKTSRVAGGTKNSFDNMTDAIAMARIEVGQSVNESYGPLADKITEAVSAASKGGVWKDFGQAVREALNLDEANVEDILVNTVAFAKTGIQVFGLLKDRVLAVLGPIAQFLWKASGFDNSVAGMTVGDLFNQNQADIRKSIAAGRKLVDAEKKRFDEAGTKSAEAALGGTSAATPPRKEEDYLHRIAVATETMANAWEKSRLSGGTFTDWATSPVSLNHLLNGRRGGGSFRQQLAVVGGDIDAMIDGILRQQGRRMRQAGI